MVKRCYFFADMEPFVECLHVQCSKKRSVTASARYHKAAKC